MEVAFLQERILLDCEGCLFTPVDGGGLSFFRVRDLV